MTKILPRNEGSRDRVLGVTLGLDLLSLVLVGPQTPGGGCVWYLWPLG